MDQDKLEIAANMRNLREELKAQLKEWETVDIGLGSFRASAGGPFGYPCWGARMSDEMFLVLRETAIDYLSKQLEAVHKQIEEL